MNPAVIQSIVAASVPTLAVLVGILINRTDANRLGGEIASLRSELKGDIVTLRSELKGDIVTLRSELRDEIATLRAQQHNDMIRLFEILGEHAQRIARLEAS